MLSNIGGRDAPPPEPAAPARGSKIGWMGYVGSALWVTLFCGAGLVAWLFFTRAG